MDTAIAGFAPLGTLSSKFFTGLCYFASMPRKPRIRGAGLMHHVVHRGINRQSIFLADADRWKFLRILRKASRKHGVDLVAYCLMDNHYHVMIDDHHGRISEMFHNINSFYTTAFNRRHGCEGELLRGRFFSRPVDDERYKLCLFRYIHLNPVKAGIVAKPNQYRWSSYAAYTGGVSDILIAAGQLLRSLKLAGIRPDQIDTWVNTLCVPLDTFCSPTQIQRWLEVQKAAESGKHASLTPPEDKLHLFSRDVAPQQGRSNLPASREAALLSLCCEVARSYGVSVGALALSQRGAPAEQKKARAAALLRCHREGRATTKELARLFQLSAKSVTKTLERTRNQMTGRER